MKPAISTDSEAFKEALNAQFSLTPAISRKMLIAGAFIIEGKAKINHRPNIDTGFLFNSIQAQSPEVDKNGSGSVDITVGAEYAPHLEYGTSGKRRRKNKSEKRKSTVRRRGSTKQRKPKKGVAGQAYPFLRPAVYDNEPLIIRTMSKIFAMEMMEMMK